MIKYKLLINKYFSLLLLIINFIFNFIELKNILFLVISSFISLFIPGFYIIKTLQLKIESYEELPYFFTTSIIFYTLIGFWYKFLKFSINYITINISIIVLFFIYSKYQDKFNLKFYKKSDKHKIISIICIIIFSLFLIKPILPYKYYLGYDCYRNKPIVDFLRSKYNDTFDLLEEKSIVFSGFYLFLLVFDNISIIDLHQITRFGGPFMLGMLSTWLFLILDDKLKSSKSIIFPFLFIITPYTLQRYLMTIRENFSLILLAFYIYLLFKWIKEKDKSWILASAVFGCIIGIHPLSSVFLLSLTAFTIAYYKRLEIIVLPFIGMIFNFPSLVTVTPWAIFFMKTVVSTLYHKPVELPFWISSRGNSSWERILRWSDIPMVQKIFFMPGILFLVKYWKEYKNIILLLCSFFTLISVMILVKNLGYSFTTVRLLLYLSIISSLVASLGVVFVEDSMSLETNFSINLFHKRYTHHNSNSINLLIIGFIILANFQSPLMFHKKAPYSFYEVNSVLNFSENYPSKDGIFIISLTEKRSLIEYGGFEPYYQERDEISNYFNASDLKQVVNKIIKDEPDTTEILVFITDFNLYVLGDKYPLLQKISDEKIVYDDDTVNVYKIY